MKRGRFEKKLSELFADKQTQPPKELWDNISKQLNYNSIFSFSFFSHQYKWAAVILLLVVFSLIYYNFSFSIFTQNEYTSSKIEKNSYLDLLLKYKQIPVNRPHASLLHSIPPFQPIDRYHPTVSPKKKSNKLNTTNKSLTSILEVPIINIHPIGSQIQLASTHWDIVSYQPPVNYLPINPKKIKNTYWSGFSVSGGSFQPNYSDVSGAATITNVNQSAISSNSSSTSISTTSLHTVNAVMSKSLEINFGMNISKNWSLESGLVYSSAEFTNVNTLDLYEETTQVKQSISIGPNPNIILENKISTESYEITVNNHLRFAAIPIRAGYAILNRQISLRVNAGISANYLLNNSMEQSNNTANNQQPLGNYNDWSFDGIGGLEIGYSFFDKVKLNISPAYRKSITPLNKTFNDQAGFQVQTGVKYLF